MSPRSFISVLMFSVGSVRGARVESSRPDSSSVDSSGGGSSSVDSSGGGSPNRSSRRLDKYRALLRDPTPVKSVTEQLIHEADVLVDTYISDRTSRGLGVEKQFDLDIVISACAYKIVWALGIHMILSRLEQRGLIEIHRYAGASSGAKLPFQVLLTGENSTVERYLSYGALGIKGLGSIRGTAWLAKNIDELNKMEAADLVDNYGQNLRALDNRLAVSVTRLSPLGPTLKQYKDDFWSTADADKVKEVYRTTGYIYSHELGYSATDGAAMGNRVPYEENSPFLTMVISPEKKHIKWSGWMSYSVEEAQKTIRHGQRYGMQFMKAAFEKGKLGRSGWPRSLAIGQSPVVIQKSATQKPSTQDS